MKWLYMQTILFEVKLSYRRHIISTSACEYNIVLNILMINYIWRPVLTDFNFGGCVISNKSPVGGIANNNNKNETKR